MGELVLPDGAPRWQDYCRTASGDEPTPGRYCVVHEDWNCRPPTSAATDCPTCHGLGWIEGDAPSTADKSS